MSSNKDEKDQYYYAPAPGFYILLRWILGIIAIGVAAYVSVVFLVEMRSLFLKLSYKPITEEVALEKAIPMKTVLPTTLYVMSGSDQREIDLRPGTNIKILGASMKLLSARADGSSDVYHPYYDLSPKVFTPTQVFLIETENGIRGNAMLPEAIIGRKIVVKSGEEAGDTLVVKGVKKIKSEDTFPYTYTVEGRKNSYNWGEFNVPVEEGQIVVYNNPFGGVPEEMQHKKAHIPSFMKIPVHEQNGFFLFPRFKIWNMYLLKPFFRSLLMLIIVWLVILVIALWRNHSHNFNAVYKYKDSCLKDTSLDNEQAQAKFLRLYWPRYYPYAFILGCLYTPLIWILTSGNHRNLMRDLKDDLSKRCPHCHHMTLEHGSTGKKTEKQFVRHVHRDGYTKKSTDYKRSLFSDDVKVTTSSTGVSALDYDLYVYQAERFFKCSECGFYETYWVTCESHENVRGGEETGSSTKTTWVKA